MSVFLNNRLGSYFLVALGIVSILPFLVISLYNNPIAGDDFFLANTTREIGFIQAQKFWYTSWTGRYFSMAVLSASPLVFGSIFLYKLIPIVLLLALTGSFYLLINALFDTIAFIDKVAIVSVFIFLYLFQLPSTAEGLYWVICSVTYLLPSVFTILVLFMLVRLAKNNSKGYFFSAAVLCFGIVGSNETSMLLMIYLLCLVNTLYCFAHKKWNPALILLMVLTLLFSAIVLLSPGNGVRQTLFPNSHNFSYSLTRTLALSAVYIPKWLPVLLLSAIVLYDVLSINFEKVKTVKILDVHPVISFLVMLSFPVLCIFPVIWSVGNENAYLRIISLAYFFLLLGFIYFIFTLFFYFSKTGVVKAIVTPFVRVLVILLVLVQLYLPHHVYHPNNIRQAYMDVLSGRAAGYDAQVAERFRVIASAQADTCLVPGLRNVSTILYPSEYPIDITKDPKDWRNASLATFFGRKAILLAPDYGVKQ